MFKVKYVDSIMMVVRLDLNLIVSLFQHKCEGLGNGLDCNTGDMCKMRKLDHDVFNPAAYRLSSWLNLTDNTYGN